MLGHSQLVIAMLLFIMLGLTACGGQGQFEPGIATPETSVSPAPSAADEGPQVFVLPRETEKRLIYTEAVPQDNCYGSAETSDTVTRSHGVLRTLELGSNITVDADGRAGIPGFGEVGIGVAVANYYQVGYGTTDTITRSTTIAAKEGTHIEHTIRHYEIWEHGELLVVAGSASQQIPYSFRKDFSIEKLPANIGCPGQATQLQQSTAEAVAETTQSPGQSVPAPTEAIITQPLPTSTSFCPFLTNGHIEQLKMADSVSDALQQAGEFAGRQQNDYMEGSTIPAGVVIATDLQNSDLSQFPVSPINNQGGWGLFITSTEFTAPNDGTYWCIQ